MAFEALSDDAEQPPTNVQANNFMEEGDWSPKEDKDGDLNFTPSISTDATAYKNLVAAANTVD